MKTAVRVTAPARLHLGFLDLNGGMGRRFGSIGVGIQGIATRLRLHHSREVRIIGADDHGLVEAVRRLLDHFAIKTGVAVQVEQQIPAHQGLGSGTQMALALGVAISRLFGIHARVEHIAAAMGRGRRSGIGIGVFNHGGFIVDSGRAGRQAVPCVISHLPFPEGWPFALIGDSSVRGISGLAETDAFAALPAIGGDLAAEVCRLVLMQTLPGIIERDCVQFGRSVSRIQQIYGEYFRPAQGGAYASERVAQAVGFLQARGATGGGQTSWGPTGFAIFPDQITAQRALTELAGQSGADSTLHVQLTAAENRPARIHSEPDDSGNRAANRVAQVKTHE